MLRIIKNLSLACSLALAVTLPCLSSGFAQSYNVAGVFDLNVPDGYTIDVQSAHGLILNNTPNQVIVINTTNSKNPNNFKYTVTKYKNNLNQLKAVLTQTYTDQYKAPYVITDIKIINLNNQDVVSYTGFLKHADIDTIYLSTIIYQKSGNLVTVEASANNQKSPEQAISYILDHNKF